MFQHGLPRRVKLKSVVIFCVKKKFHEICNCVISF